MSRGCDRVRAGGQQSPVVSSTGCGDIVVYLCHTNGGIGNSCSITTVRDCALDSCVDLKRHITAYTRVDAKLSESDEEAQSNVEICVCYLVYKLKQSSSVLFPVLRQFLGRRILYTTQLNGHFETVGVQVVPVLHPTWEKCAPLNSTSNYKVLT